MDTAINDYKARREKRLAERGIYPENVSRIIAFAKRRAERLDARGFREDAPEDEEQNNNQSGGGSAGGHGNTKLPFGLCKRFGIEIDPSWTPKDAWAALADKGITPDGAYGRLKKGEDPGTPESPEPSKEPVKKISDERYGGAEYEGLRGSFSKWATRGSDPWKLYGDKVDGTGDGSWSPMRMSLSFRTKMDMLRWLKEKGVEEFEDPETGEKINPSEMEFPEPKIVIGRAGYTDLAIGLRDGRYTLTAKDMDGKSRKLGSYASLSQAKEMFAVVGAKEEDIKLSPALRKREKERLAWLTSDKKEYFQDTDGTRFGDVRVEREYGEWAVFGESEDGRRMKMEFGSKAEAMRFLKDQGVQRVKDDTGGFTDPQDYEIPEAVATIGGKDYQEIGVAWTRGGELQVYGVDLDGQRSGLDFKYGSETYNQFLERMERRYGITEDKFTINEEAQKQIDRVKKEEEEREQRRKEFEAKAIPFYGGRYADVELVKDPDTGWFSFYGYSSDGRRRQITHSGDMYDMRMYAKKYGQDINNLIKDKEVRKEYDRYMDSIKEFEEKATDIAGEKYADISISYIGGRFKVSGYDERGREKEIARESSYEDLEKVLNQYGYSPTMFPMDDGATERKDKALRAKYALATGGYYSLGKKDAAYKDIRVEEDDFVDNMWKIIGTDVDGKDSVVDSVKSWDDAVGKMSEYGVSDYKMKDKSGTELKMPTYGMHKVMLMKKPSGGFAVYADSDRFGKSAVMYETQSESDARKWLRDNNVPESGLKTRGMNPNDDVVRNPPTKAMEKFDAHRMKAIEGTFIDDMTETDKKDAADMMAEIFKNGEYRVARSTSSLAGILENGYKSQIETGTGGHGASKNKELRKRCSDGMYGHGGLDKTEYEKMGYIAPADIAEDYDSGDHPFYGGNSPMTYTLKKDAMKDRTTYTFGDSLNTYSSGYLKSAGYAGEKPTIEGLTGLGWKGNMDNALREYRRYKKGELTFSEMFSRIRNLANNDYIELQFTGPVTAKDIQKVSFDNEAYIKNAFSRMTQEQRKKSIQVLKDNGIEIEYRPRRGQPFTDGWEWIKKHYPEDVA